MNPELRLKQTQANDKADKATEEEKQLVSTLHQRFNRAQQAVQSRHKKWALLDKFDRGKQWEDAELPPWIPKPIHNLIRQTRILKRSNLASAIPSAHYAAIHEDQKDAVTMLQRGYKHVWDTQKVAYTIRRCIDRIFLQGTQVACVYNEEDINGTYYGKDNPKNRMYQGTIRVKRFPIANFFPDPSAYTIEECKFIETTEITTLEAVKANKKFKEFAGQKLASIKAGTYSLSDDESGSIYNRENKPLEGMATDKKDDRAVVHTHWEMAYNDEGKKELNVYYYLAGAEFLLYKRENVKPCVFPFAVLHDEEEDNDFFGTGTAEDLLEKQKLINKTEQSASVIGTLNQNPQKVVARESGINGQDMARTGSQPGKVWTTNIDPTRSVYNIPVPDIPRGLFDLKDRNVADIKDYVGMNEAYMGNSVGSLTTSTGVNSLIERATVRDKDKMLQIDRFVEQISDLIVLFIIESWKDKRPIINSGPAGRVDNYMFDPQVIKDVGVDNLQWFVKSDVYASAPITQALKRQQADQMLQVQMQFNPDPAIITIEEWLHMQDFDNKDEILARMQRDRIAKQQREAMDMTQIVMDMVNQAQQLTYQGTAPAQVQQQIQQQVSEVLQQQQQAELLNGRPRDAEQQPQGPAGSTGQTAMNNMTRGAI